jgi:L-threonylcarbamoyladenylate synthase
MPVVEATPEKIKEAADILKKGGIVSFPTETVYGLGADALNPSAVAGIFEAKKRPFFDPLIIHIAEMKSLEQITGKINSRTIKLTEKFWPGALTVVLEKKSIVPDIVTSGLNTAALRMPSHPVALSLIKTAGTPVAAPSANRFGCLSPTRAEHVENQLGSGVDIILDGGPCSIGIESTIIKIDDSGLYLLRAGGIAAEEIEECAGEKVLTPGHSDIPEAPGQLPWHYSPDKKIVITDTPPINHKRCGYLFFSNIPDDYPADKSFVLSSKGDLREAAASLFAHLHTLDSMEIDIIYAQPVPRENLGTAIMDRLEKASKKI